VTPITVGTHGSCEIVGVSAHTPSLEPVRHAGDLLIEQTPSATRIPITTAELERAIAAEVNAVPGCEAFVGVIIQRTPPKSRLDANWEIRGIRFGRVDREIARQAVGPIVERMRRQFCVSNWPIESPPGTAGHDARKIKGIATAATVCLGVLAPLVLWLLSHQLDKALFLYRWGS
jgi:hypothetical protein